MKGKYVLLHNKLKEDPGKFFKYKRMSIRSLQSFLSTAELN